MLRIVYVVPVQLECVVAINAEDSVVPAELNALQGPFLLRIVYVVPGHSSALVSALAELSKVPRMCTCRQ